MNNHFDILIIGGGAAGFFAAVNAAEFSSQKRIAILEKSNKVLSKVRVSGGGRCNVTHACFDNRELIKYYPRGAKELLSAFSRFSVNETIAWFEQRGVQLKTEDDGRMFPVTDDSSTIVDCLLQEAEKSGVEILLHSDVVNIVKSDTAFSVELKTGERFSCEKLLIAAGGFPKITGYDFLKSCGHTIIPPVPSLFTFNMPGNPVIALMGVSVENAEVKIRGTKICTDGPLLITHWGMSGPAVLKASAWGAHILAEKNYAFEIEVNWIPGKNEDELNASLLSAKTDFNTQLVFNLNPFRLPKRLWNFMLVKSGISDDKKWADLSNHSLRKLVNILHAGLYQVSGKTTFKEEFVTSGGVRLGDVDFKTMQSRITPGLFFAGEILNIDAVTGGFNFQSAWTTGWIAAAGMAGNQD